MPPKRPRDSTSAAHDTFDSPLAKRPRAAYDSNSPHEGRTLFGSIIKMGAGIVNRFGNVFKGRADVPSRSEMRQKRSTLGLEGQKMPVGVRSLRQDGEPSSGALRLILDADAERTARDQADDATTSSRIPAATTNMLRTPSPDATDPPAVMISIEKRPAVVQPESFMFDEGTLRAGRPGSSTPLEDDSNEGTRAQPISLEDSDSEDDHDDDALPTTPGASMHFSPASASSSRIAPVRPPPRRPQLAGHVPPERTYSWMVREGTAPSSNLHSTQPSTRSLGRRKTGSNKALRRNVRKVDESLERLRKQLEIAQRGEDRREIRALTALIQDKMEKDIQTTPMRMERRYKAAISAGGKDSKEAYQALLYSTMKRGKPLEEVVEIKPTTPKFSLDKVQRHAQDAKKGFKQRRQSNVTDIVLEFQKAHIQEEKEIQKRLRPACPTKMGAARAAQVAKHLQNPDFKAGQIQARQLRRLLPLEWLDDEVINTYGELMTNRYKDAAKEGKVGSLKDIFFHNSFFYSKLSGKMGYDGVRRWTKKVDIFAKDAVIFPINVGNMHWVAGCINVAEKRFEYYDSLGGGARDRQDVYDIMRMYIEKEHQNKKGSPIDLSDWTDSHNGNNGSDCGVFTCQTLEAISRGRDLSMPDGFDFTSDNMPYIRKLMVHELAQEKLEPRWPKETD